MQRLYILLIMIILCVGVGCQDKEKLLEERVNTFIMAKNSGDIEKIYESYRGEYREQVSLAQFKNLHNMRNIKMKLERIEREADAKTATVYVSSTFRPMGFELKDVNTALEWVFEDGNWYIATKVPSFQSIFQRQNSISK